MLMYYDERSTKHQASFISTHFRTVQQVALEPLLPQTFTRPPLITILQRVGGLSVIFISSLAYSRTDLSSNVLLSA
jgi:hypothetical protein